ncbi:hypothetical protein HYZ99_04710 [Candidatus Peregrinibacteria bacterium]|nr:hypothetical protein [Candidatus Peregrinibacteria bacterium]
MANRDVALGLCGVVVGVMLGAGSMLYAQEATLSASSTDEVAAVYFDVPEEPPTARDIDRIRVDEETSRSHAEMRRLNRPNMNATEPHESAPVLPDDACDVAKNLSARMTLAIDTVIPRQEDNNYTIISSNLKVVLRNIVTDYCGSEQEAAAAEEDTGYQRSAAPVRVDNDCEQYEEGSNRLAKCLGNQLENRPYVD